MKRLKRRMDAKQQAGSAGPRSAPEGMRIYAVGDIHGHRAELDLLLAKIEEDGRSARDVGNRVSLVFLGDYIDRGPDTRGVIDRLLDKDLPADEVHFLMGNHERVLLDILYKGARGASDWLHYGGFEMLQSYGLSRKEVIGSREPLAERIRAVMPAAHVDFLCDARLKLRLGDYFFVHAGVRPGVPLAAQEDRDLLWIRDGFVNRDHDFGAVVVHGHTIESEPVDLPHRIGLDTGCYAGGGLTAVRLEGTTRRFLSVPSTGSSWSRRPGYCAKGLG